jgi:glycosyltransferase involved in cell wall biosynthesis
VEVVFTKEGKGAGYARNVGMEHAVGKWLVFADADDYFHPCIADLMDDYRDAEEDMVFFKHDDISVNSSFSDYGDYACRMDHINYYIDMFDFYRNNSRFLLRYKHNAVWGRFIKHALVAKYELKFPEILRTEDLNFATAIGFYAHKIIVNKCVGHSVSSRVNSLVSAMDSQNKFCKILEFTKFFAFYRKENIEVPFHNEKLWTYNDLLELYIHDRDVFQKVYREMQAFGFSKEEIVHNICGIAYELNKLEFYEDNHNSLFEGK